MKRSHHLTVLLAILVTVPAFAGVVDDAIALANRGVSDEIILSWAEGKGGEAISVNDILRMKDNKVPDRVVALIIRQQNRAAPAANVAQAEPMQNEAQYAPRESVRYVERPSVSYVTPAVYAPVAYREPLYYSSYDRYPYYSSYYPYRSYPSVGLSLSFGSSRYYGNRYSGSYGHRYSGGYGSHYGSHYGGSHYGSGSYSSGHYGSGHYSGGYSGYSGGTGYRTSGGTGYRSSSGTGYRSSRR